ncbi:unnamed protein product [Cuscuta epithymum]|uniref:C2 domain-containing protein n=1 Tax=Cuscuta epithymum TaxID=186058 RepID=A0AAV0D5A8_9ASTE|nr:unnamed protein product [Cuscuta epithymum]
MGDTLGQLKITVLKGRRLVIRDFRSSDPYVILELGNQMAKTKVINSCLDPVWNEEFTFTLSDPAASILKLRVFDKDRFKADDKMGHAHVNLHPLMAAARLRQIVGISCEDGPLILRKVIPESDNCLVVDSSIFSEKNGDVVQDVRLRLRDVKSGEVELRMKLTNLPVPHK